MIPIEQVYPDAKHEYYFSVSDYQPLLDSLGCEILAQVDDNDYQGESRLLLRGEQGFGYLRFGWGSCSGCDALQGCSSYQEVNELRQELWDSVIWQPDAKEMLLWIANRDWDGAEGTWHNAEILQFRREATAALEGLFTTIEQGKEEV